MPTGLLCLESQWPVILGYFQSSGATSGQSGLVFAATWRSSWLLLLGKGESELPGLESGPVLPGPLGVLQGSYDYLMRNFKELIRSDVSAACTP